MNIVAQSKWYHSFIPAKASSVPDIKFGRRKCCRFSMPAIIRNSVCAQWSWTSGKFWPESVCIWPSTVSWTAVWHSALVFVRQSFWIRKQSVWVDRGNLFNSQRSVVCDPVFSRDRRDTLEIPSGSCSVWVATVGFVSSLVAWTPEFRRMYLLFIIYFRLRLLSRFLI